VNIQVADYDPGWPAVYERLRRPIWNAVCDLAPTDARGEPGQHPDGTQLYGELTGWLAKLLEHSGNRFDHQTLPPVGCSPIARSISISICYRAST